MSEESYNNKGVEDVAEMLITSSRVRICLHRSLFKIKVIGTIQQAHV